LATIDYNRPFTLQTDASAFAIGATLTQKQEDGTEKPVAFFSASLQPAEINYDIFDRELLAIVKVSVTGVNIYLEQDIKSQSLPITTIYPISENPIKSLEDRHDGWKP
jgi:hypothetical protein